MPSSTRSVQSVVTMRCTTTLYSWDRPMKVLLSSTPAHHVATSSEPITKQYLLLSVMSWSSRVWTNIKFIFIRPSTAWCIHFCISPIHPYSVLRQLLKIWISWDEYVYCQQDTPTYTLYSNNSTSSVYLFNYLHGLPALLVLSDVQSRSPTAEKNFGH